MKTIQLYSLKNQLVIADKCHVAKCFFDRLKGLIGRTSLREGEGMWFPRCNDIHMWFMSVSIDVVFARRERSSSGALKWVVTSAHSDVRPWKVLPLRDRKATDTFELPVGTLERCSIRDGDELCIN